MLLSGENACWPQKVLKHVMGKVWISWAELSWPRTPGTGGKQDVYVRTRLFQAQPWFPRTTKAPCSTWMVLGRCGASLPGGDVLTGFRCSAPGDRPVPVCLGELERILEEPSIMDWSLLSSSNLSWSLNYFDWRSRNPYVLEIWSAWACFSRQGPVLNTRYFT